MEATMTNTKNSNIAFDKRYFSKGQYNKKPWNKDIEWEPSSSDIKQAMRAILRLKQENEISESTFKVVIQLLATYYVESLLSDKMKFLNYKFCNTFYRNLLHKDII